MTPGSESRPTVRMDTPEQESTDNANSAQTFSADQQRAYDKCMQMQPPTPVFITGAAGSGKTHVLKKVIEDYKAQSNASKTVAVTASTGLAGTIIGGVTLHAYFSKYFDMKGRKMRENIHTAAQRVKCDMNKRLRKLSVLVIDEISMIKKEEMDIVNMVLQYVHEKPDMPFGGVKVIVCGDFHQLPPVIITENGVQPPDSEMPFAFEADCWHHFDVSYLRTIHRQNDPVFIRVLNEVRSGELSQTTINILRNKVPPSDEAEQELPLLCSTRDQTDARNQQKLLSLDDVQLLESKASIQITEGKRRLSNEQRAKIVRSFPASEILKLRIGARVMMLVNNFVDGLVNGHVGTVIGFIQLYGETYPLVQFDHCEDIEYCIMEYRWERVESNGFLAAAMTQIPLALCWAVTIHKSQGLNMDAAVLDFDRIFAAGQAYVGMSRVVDFDKLFIKNFDATKIKASPKVLQYYRSIMENLPADDSMEA